jgi:hypothetical protein
MHNGIKLPGCSLSYDMERVVTRFSDGKINEMHRSGVDTDEQRRIARWAGYGDDWWAYTVEHDMTHAWFASVIGWQWSKALHDPEPIHIDNATDEMRWEEHCVNRLQRQVRTGEPDEYGCLQKQFGDTLDKRIAELAMSLEVSGPLG